VLERVGRNVLSNWTGLSPFLVHTLGDAQYGLWVLIVSVTGYMGLLDVGLKVSVVKFVAGLSAKGDDAALSSIISTALTIYGLLSIVLLAVAATAGPALDELFKMPAALAPVARLVLVISATTLSVTLLASVFNGFFAGLQRYDICNAVGIGSTVLSGGAIYLAISAGMGIVGLALVHLAAQVLSGSLLCWLALRSRPQLRIGLDQVSFATMKQLYGYGIFVLLNSVAMLLLFRSGELVAGFRFDAAAVTYFAIGGMLVEYLGRVVGTMTQVLHPLASAQLERGDEAGLRQVLIVSTRACIAIALPACAGFIIIGEPFIEAWMGDRYAAVSGPILAVLAIARFFWLAQSGAGNILLGAGRHRQQTMFTAATGVFGILMAIILSGPLGLLGVAVGLAIAIVTCQGLLMPVYLCRSMQIPAGEYLRGALAGPAIATLPFAVALYALVELVHPRSVGMIALALAATAPLFLVTAYFSCLGRNERARLRAFLRGSGASTG